MNTLIFSEDYPPQIGGIAAHVHNLARAISRSGSSIGVMTTRKTTSKRNLSCWRARRIVRDGVAVLEVPVIYSPRRVLWALQQRMRFARLARKEIHRLSASVFHYHGIWFDPPVAVGVNGSAAIVFTNHSSQFLQHCEDPGMRRKLLSMFCFAHRVIAPSQELADSVVKLGYPTARVTYIPNGVDVEQFCPNNEERSKSRAKLEIQNHQVAVLCARRIVPKNGILYFVRALSRLRCPKDVVILLTGLDGDLGPRDLQYEAEIKTELEKVVGRLQVRILGQVPHEQMLSLYRSADISVLPSLIEATSIAGLESMAVGLPLVGTTVGGIPDLIEEGRSGLLIPPRDPEAIASAIDSLAGDRDLRIQMGKRARHLTQEKFSWTAISASTQQVYGLAVEDFRIHGRVKCPE